MKKIAFFLMFLLYFGQATAPLATYLPPIFFKIPTATKNGRLVSNSVATRTMYCVSRRERSTPSV